MPYGKGTYGNKRGRPSKKKATIGNNLSSKKSSKGAHKHGGASVGMGGTRAKGTGIAGGNNLGTKKKVQSRKTTVKPKEKGVSDITNLAKRMAIGASGVASGGAMLGEVFRLLGDNKRKPLMLPPSKYPGNIGEAKRRKGKSMPEILYGQRKIIKLRGLEPRRDIDRADHRFHEINAHHRLVDSQYAFLYGAPPIGIGPKMSPFSKKNRKQVRRMNVSQESFGREYNKLMREHGLPKMF